MENLAGVRDSNLLRSADFDDSAIDMAQVPSEGGAVLGNLGMAILNVAPDAVAALAMDSGETSAILAVEPEGMMYALSELRRVSCDYLRGFRDCAQSLYDSASSAFPGSMEDRGLIEEISFLDSPTHTWGLVATKAATSRFTGQGVNLAVLDTGLDLSHPDFIGRTIVSRSFIPDVESANDGHGHGTHCTGTACGAFHPGIGPRYGVAHKANIYIGKVLSDSGKGGDGGVLAAIDWAVANSCHVISISLGADVPASTLFYETAGQRALSAGSLIVAAAGNNADRSAGNFGFVGRAANSRTFMAVGALDGNLRMGNFSARDTYLTNGTAVDIAAPGVSVNSSWPTPARYRSINGTSMATPHVAGIAALWAQSSGARGAALWHQVITSARALSLPIVDVGRGLVQAP
ncbi:MAG: S8 family serine peptidase [Cyanobacteriota bacterium]|nr:S8 family serine peptidase [Cyanobacteriota bacterium]